jgi:hypothetical protein
LKKKGAKKAAVIGKIIAKSEGKIVLKRKP